MPSTRMASITIGIDNYAADHYRRPGFALRYAAADAEAFHSYLTQTWPANTTTSHILLRDRDATHRNIEEAFSELGRLGRLDLFIAYFAGHAEVEQDGQGWFCASDTAPDDRGFSPHEFDQLLFGINAGITILVLDCCYAESVISTSKYFAELGDAHAKLFLCSARRNQRTFEDESWGHGALSFVLLNALADGSPIHKKQGAIAVEGTLFPYLCQQVPLLVFQAKGGAKQEPIMGAISATSVSLPAGSAGIHRRHSSIFATVRARYRQMIAATVSVALITLIVSQVILYHFAIGVDGYIQVRRGLAQLYWTTIPGFELHVETTIHESELTRLNVEYATRLRSGTVWGVWSQRNSAGLRRWSDKLLPFLAPQFAERLALLTGKGLPKSTLARDRFSATQWRPDIVAASVLLEPNTADRIQTVFLSRLPDLSEFDCSVGIDNRFDFTLLNMSNKDILFYLDTLRVYLERKNKFAPQLVESATKLVGYRARHMTREFAGVEFETAATEYRALLRLFEQVGNRALLPIPLPTTSPGWCEPVALALAALTTNGPGSDDLIARLVHAVDPQESKAGDLLSFRQFAALEALEVVARKRRLPDDTIRDIYTYLHADGRGLEGHPNLVEWLNTIATLQVLPRDIVNALQTALGRPHPEDSFIRLRSFGVLARNARHATTLDHAAVMTHSASVIDENSGTQELATVLGYLGCAGLGRQRSISYLTSRIDEHRLVRPTKQEVLGFEIIAAGEDFAEGTALGRIAQTGVVDDAIFKRLETFAASRLGVIDQTPIVRALALRNVKGLDSDAVIQRIKIMMSESLTSARQRLVQNAVATDMLLLLPTSTRAEAIEAARSAWLVEREPILKISWASIFLDARKRLPTFDQRPCL